MTVLVLGKVELPHERLVAAGNVADVRAQAGVRPLVGPQVADARELPRALGAAQGLLTSVRPSVGLEVCLPEESLWADFALEGLDPAVREDVPAHVAAQGEGLGAPRVRAGESGWAAGGSGGRNHSERIHGQRNRLESHG